MRKPRRPHSGTSALVVPCVIGPAHSPPGRLTWIPIRLRLGTRRYGWASCAVRRV